MALTTGHSLEYLHHNSKSFVLPSPERKPPELQINLRCSQSRLTCLQQLVQSPRTRLTP